MEIGDVAKVAENVYGRVLDVYDNGCMTTAGFTEDMESYAVDSVTYDSEHADCMPVGFPDMLWLDDNNVRQHIKEILWDNEGDVFLMADGTLSGTVTN